MVYELEAAATQGSRSSARIEDDISSEEDSDKEEDVPREGPDTGPLDQAVF